MEQKSILKKITGSREASLVIVLIVMLVIISIFSPSFLSPTNLGQIFRNNTLTMLMALGMLCVMLVGGIDISITSTLALAGMAIGMLLKYDHIHSTFLVFVIAILIGLACGIVVGLVISRAGVPPIIATMGFMYIYRAMAYLISRVSSSISASVLSSMKSVISSIILSAKALFGTIAATPITII